MKRRAHLFIETGEIRVAKDGEWAMTSSGPHEGEIYLADGDCTEKDFILARHSRVVPKGTDGVFIQMITDVAGVCATGEIIPIPRPKIKKWIYEFDCHGITWKSARPISEIEYKSQPMTGHKILETEVEE